MNKRFAVMILFFVMILGAALMSGRAEADPSAEELTWIRLAGSNRYRTMEKISKTAFENGSCKTIIVATGQAFPDALAGASLAGVYECPIILTKTAALVPEAKEEIERLAAPEGCTVLLLGGTGALQESVEEAIRSIDHVTKVERIKGKNREQTALQVYERGREFWGDTVIISTGYSFADALSISPYAYASKTPILLCQKNGSLSDEVKETLSKGGFKKAILVGGTGAVSLKTENLLASECGMTVLRLQGKDRYETGAEMIRWELGLKEDAAFQPAVKMSPEGMGVATGTNYADALSATSLLGKNHSVLMLVSNKKNTLTKIRDIVTELVMPGVREMTKGYIFGGRGSVNEEIEQILRDAVLDGTANPEELIPQILWTEKNATLTYCCKARLIAPGETYNGETVTTVWSGTEVTDSGEYPAWKMENSFKKILIEKSFSYARPHSLFRWFSSMSDEMLTGLENLNTSQAARMDWMFAGSTFTKLDLSSFDTSKVQSMDMMFYDCTSLVELRIGNFRTPELLYATRMFDGCSSLITLDLSGFDLSGMKDMSDMFYSCEEIRTIYCHDSDSEWLFEPELEKGDWPFTNHNQYLTGQYGDKEVHFSGCELKYAKSAKLDGYFTPKYVKVHFDPNGGEGEMEDQWVLSDFYFYSEVTYLNKNGFTKEGFCLVGWNTKADGSGDFYKPDYVIRAREDLTLYAQWIEEDRFPQAIWTEEDKTLTFLCGPEYHIGDVFNGQTVDGVWSGESVTSTGNGVYPDWVYGIMAPVEKMVFDESFSKARPASLHRWFAGCSDGQIIGIENLNTSEVTDMSLAFWNAALTKIDLSHFDVSKVTDMSYMFDGCLNLKTIYCAGNDTDWALEVPEGCRDDRMFGRCNKLKGTSESSVIPFDEQKTGLESAKSAKLGGYFTPKYMKITFDANEGEGEMEDQMVTSFFFNQKGMKLPFCTFIKEDYYCAGWNTEPDGSGDFYKEGAKIAPKSDLTLYAQWEQD